MKIAILGTGFGKEHAKLFCRFHGITPSAVKAAT